MFEEHDNSFRDSWNLIRILEDLKFWGTWSLSAKSLVTRSKDMNEVRFDSLWSLETYALGVLASPSPKP